MFLLVVEDRHAERDLRAALAGARAAAEKPLVLTADALLAMRLRRDGVDARLTIHRLSTDAVQAIARVRAGRATRWVNTAFRALLLEPGFIWLLFLQGLWRRIAGSPLPEPRRRALIVVGDRFTADVIERVSGQPRPIVLAGA